MTILGRVLVVDDHEWWRSYVCAILENHPQWLIVAEASNGLEAVDKALALKPDVILLDLGLPALNGIGTARQILTAVPHARILFLSAHRSPSILKAALSTGAHGYLLKSDVEDLLVAMEAISEGKRFISEGLKSEGGE